MGTYATTKFSDDGSSDEDSADSTTKNPDAETGSARSIEKEQDMGYGVVGSGDEVKDEAAEDFAAVLAASLAFVAVVVIGVALFYALRAKDGKVEKVEKVADGMIVGKDVTDAVVEMVTESPI